MPFRVLLRVSAQAQLLPYVCAQPEEEETLIGGQAVLEGVMMRAPHSYCVAVRKPSGLVVTEEKPLPKLSEKHPLWGRPIVRGIGTLGQALSLGMKALRFSANAALEEGDGKGRKTREAPGWLIAVNIAFSLAFFIFLYKFVPLYLATALEHRFPVLGERVLFNLVDGIIRVLLFVGFLYGVSRWKDIRRVFEYHGAEHRVVFNFESGRPVTVQTAQTFPTLHPRCGTSFLMVVMLVSVAVYTLLPFESFTLKFVGRVALLPLIAGLSYELIRFAAKHRGGLLATLTAPGLWLQRITTQPPADDQTQVAIRALEGALELERAQGGRLVIC